MFDMGLLDKQFTDDNIVITNVEDLFNWARLIFTVADELWIGLLCN